MENVMHGRPTKFDLSGKDLEVHYGSGDSATFDVRDGVFHRSFPVRDLDWRPLPFGSLIVVTTLPSDRAGRTRQLGLLLPRFNRPGTQEFSTVAIVITDGTNEVGANGQGPIQLESVTLTGSASA